MSGSFPTANYPNGFTRGVTIRGIPVLNSHSKNVLWVDSNGSSNGAGTFASPYATVDGAINKASAGDIILVKENHAETLTTSNTVTMDVAGVAIVGLGRGQRRPRFTFTPSAVGDNSWAISAASCSVENIIGIAGLDAITNPFNVSGAAAYLDIEWQDASAAIEAETVILTTTAADQITIKLTYRGFPAGNACVAPIKLNGATDARVEVDFYGLASTAVVNFVTTLSTNVLITGYAFNSTDTTGAKLVVDTIGSSLWYADIYAGAAGQRYKGGSAAAIAGDPTISAVTDALYGGNGVASWPAEAAAANAVSIAEVLLYIQNAVRRGSGTTLAANKSIADALGTDGSTVTDSAVTVLGAIGANSANNTFSSSSVAANADGSVLERLEDIQYTEKVVMHSAAVIADATATIFTVAGGPIEVQNIISVCVSGNDATATLLKYTADPTNGSAVDLCAASATLASAAAGTIVNITGTLANPAVIAANGVAISQAGKVVVPAGVIQTITSGGATTGTWTHHLYYKPLAKGVTVTAAA